MLMLVYLVGYAHARDFLDGLLEGQRREVQLLNLCLGELLSLADGTAMVAPEHATGLDNKQLWPSQRVDTANDGRGTERPHGRVQRKGLDIQRDTLRKSLCKG